MKVCILGPITTKSYYGGVAVFDEELALGFHQSGHSACIVTYQKDATHEYLFGTVPVHIVRSKRQFSKWIKLEKPDLIIGSLGYPKLLGHKRISDAKVVYFLHGFFTRSYYGYLKSVLVPIYQKYLIRKADYVFANSDFTRMVNREFFGIDVDKVFRIGVSDDFFEKTKDISIHEKEGGTILFAGRLVSAKGVDRLIKAMEILDTKGKHYKLLIAGDGPDKSRMERYAVEKGLKIVFLGMVSHDRISELYRKAELFVSLNPSEPFGITFVEALLSKCKIVCPTTGGQVEYLQDWKESVAFVNSDSAEDIASGVEMLLDKGVYPELMDAEREKYTYRSVARKIAAFLLK